MREIANQFSDQMDMICNYVDLITSTIKLANTSQKGLRSKHEFVLAATNLATTAHNIGNFTIAAYDGAYLTACAEYELTIRNLIETYATQAADKCIDYQHLPKNIRDWYPTGCAKLILSVDQDKYSHLTKDMIISSIASCVRPSRSKGYSLLGEVFSDSNRNFWASEIEECFKRIGIDKIWQKLSREKQMQDELGTRNPGATEQRSRIKLKELLQRRNDIVHRGKTYYTPSESEVRDCASFFKILVKNLALVMENQIAAI